MTNKNSKIGINSLIKWSFECLIEKKAQTYFKENYSQEKVGLKHFKGSTL